MEPAPRPYGTAKTKSIQYREEIEKPSRPRAVSRIDTITIHLV